MKNLISTLYNFKSLPVKVKAAAIVILVLTFSIFRLISFRDNTNISNSLTGVLRSEYSNANSYAMSKAMADLESLNVITCVVLTEKSDLYRVFYDTSANSGCFKNDFLKNLFTVNTELTAINGLSYDLQYRLPLSWSWLFLETLSYILILISFWIYAQSWLIEQSNNEIKIKVLAMEKDMVMDMAKQVRHDVASPISSLRAIVKVLNNIDPEIKEFLSRAIGRTEDIFNQLNESTQKKAELGAVNISSCLIEILNEKSIQWAKSCDVVFNPAAMISLNVFGDSIQLKRIISNILNNAYESLEQDRMRKISVLISQVSSDVLVTVTDTGKGIPEDVLKKLGNKGLSSGKAGHQTAGSGLGVHHAMTTVRSWGGDLSFTSSLGQGTETTIRLRSI